MARQKLPKEDLAAKKASFQNVAARVEDVPADQFLKNNFLPYAWSFTLNRALTDVSGLKPVQRRILYTMFKRGLSPTASRQKVATLGGAVLAIHPHGDQSVAEALKNLGRDHIFRVPLIDGKGDFGSPGAPGAAARYLEARLNKAAWINLQEISENAVAMVPSYDDETVEPSKIPVRWPVAIINGGSGIAVGYASNMPSHNPTEIMEAAKLLLKDPDTTYKDLLKIVKGPDFNMGGAIISNDGVKEYLETGKGTFKIRGQYNVEHLPRKKSRIEFYELPYGTYPEKIVEEIQKGSEKGLFKEFVSYKDLSDLKHPTRVVIETKPGTQHQKVLKELFANTSLESSFSANITTVVKNKPLQSGIKELLLDFIDFRKSCVTNKMRYSKEKKQDRLHLIEGLLKVLLDIDKAIAIIRGSDDATVANEKLQKQFKITEPQAAYVLSLQLRRLTKMDSLELKQEGEKLKEELTEIEKILTEEEALINYLIQEFDDTINVIGSPRKTTIFNGNLKEFMASERAAIKEATAITKDQPAYLTRFASGKIMVSLKKFSYELGDVFEHGPIVESIKTTTGSDLVIVSKDGVGHKVPVKFLHLGKPMTTEEIGVPIAPRDFVGVSLREGYGLAIGTKNGVVKVAKPDFGNKDEFPVITLAAGDEIVNTRWIPKDIASLSFIFISKEGMATTFESSAVRPSGTSAGGVAGMKLRSGDQVVYFGAVKDRKNSVIVSQGVSSIKATPLLEIKLKGRGGMGVVLQSFGKEKKDIRQVYVGPNPIMTLNAEDGTTPISVPSLTPRAARGSDFNLPVLIGSSEI